jgi:hypothetical protein
MRYKPRHLPQVSAPFTHVSDKLEDEGVDYEMVNVDPEELKPMQGIVLSNEVGEFDDNKKMDPIWVSKDNEIIDGHHRFMKSLMAKKPIKCVRLSLNGKDGARVLNKIQDIYEYEEQRKMEEVVLQDVINQQNDKDSGFSDEEVLNMDIPEGNKQKLVAYRQEPIKENSVVGNYFVLSPVDGYDKYEIEFDNLLDTEQLGLDCDGDIIPIEVVAKAWFPNMDFEKMSAELGVPQQNLKTKAISDRAHEMGFDGIKYGNTLLQGLK